MIILITGASGSGKTFLTKKLSEKLQNNPEFYFVHFDTIGVPEKQEMIKNYGSQEKWQEWAVCEWVNRLSKIDKNIIILEGQFNPEFAISSLDQNNISNYKIINIYSNRKIRENRLLNDRNQPELINDDMENWSAFLRRKTLKIGGRVIENNNDYKIALKKLLMIING